MDTLLQNIRYSFRRLLQSPGFSLVVLLTLALGIGANTAIFSVVNAVLLRPLAYGDPERLVTIEHFYPSLNNLQAPVSIPGFQDYRDRTHSFSGVAVESRWNVNLTGLGEPERLNGSRVTGRFFSTLAVPAQIGRTILGDEDQAGRDRVVVLSYGLWQRLFGGEPSAVGKTINLNGESYQIVGVMPRTFYDFFGRNVEIWAPLVFTPDQLANARRTNEWLSLTARLQPGITIEQAQGELRALAEQLKQDNPNSYPADWSLLVTSFTERAQGNIRPALLLLLGAVGFVLLIACANVANLLLARAAGRRKEIAVRTALGATRWRIIHQLLSESVLLALVGGVIGLILAYWGVKSLVALNADNLPRAGEIAIDARVTLFTLLLSLVTGLLFGLAPALQTTSANLHGALKEGGRGGTAEQGGRRIRRALVVAEFALALTLLTGAGLLIKSFARLQNVDPGFLPANLLTFTLSLPAAKYPADTQQIAFFDRVFPQLRSLPGVQSAGGSSVMPFGGSWSTGSFAVEGYQPAANEPGPWGDIRIVSPGFLETLQVPLIKGRTLTDQDGPTAPRVTVVDEQMVKRFWPNEDPLGKRLGFGSDSARLWMQVVGVVAHTMHEGLDAKPRVQLYLSYRQFGIDNMALAVRAEGDPLSVVNAARAAVRSVDPDQPISQVRTMDQLLEQSVGQRKFAMLLLGLFAGLALLLAALGIYGVMSYVVSQRSRELGVRIALGADQQDVLRLVMGQGMLWAVLGVGLGIAAAFALTRLIAGQLFEVQATDPATFILVTVLLIGIALVANLVPALRATRVDPVVALREE